MINGRNIYPQDVEHVAEASHSALRRHAGAAFSVDIAGRERLIIIQELHRPYAEENFEQAVRAIRSSVANAFEVSVYSVVLLKSGATCRTTSGKIRRRTCRSAFLNGTLDALGRWDLTESAAHAPSEDDAASADASRRRSEELIGWLRTYASERVNSRLMDERRCIPPHIVLDFGNHGLLGLQVPELYGGLALRNSDVVRVVEQLGAIDLTLALFVGNHNALGIRPLLKYGSPVVRDEWIPSLAHGRELAAFALTEPGAGSNPRAIAAKATSDSKGGWRLNGTKQWIGSASWAGVITVFVQLSQPNQPSGVTAFALRQGAKGLRHGPEALTMGMRGMVQNAIFLNDVAVSDDNLLGTPGSGLEVAQDAMMFGRLGLAATAVGGMKRCAQLMLRYAQRRSISSGRLVENPVTLSRFTDLIASTAAVEAIVHTVADLLDEGVRVPDEVFVTCKISGTEYLWRAADDLVQLLGGRGYMESNIAAQILRDARVFRIFEGPTETLQTFLGASVLHAGNQLFAFLRDRLNGEDIVRRLHSAAEQIRALYADGSAVFQDRTAMLSWVHFQIGRVACAAILLAFLRHAAARSGAPTAGQPLAWADLQFDHAIASATQAGSGLHSLKAQDVADTVSSYAASVGVVDQTCAGEDDALDWLLRPDVAAAAKQKAAVLVSAPKIDDARSENGRPVSGAGLTGGCTNVSSHEIERWIKDWLIRELKLRPDAVHADRAFADFGLDSTTAIMLVADLEEFLGEEFDTTLAWDFPTISSLAAFAANRSRTARDPKPGQSAAKPG